MVEKRRVPRASYRTILWRALALWVCAVSPCSAANSATPAPPASTKSYSLGVFPYLPPRELEKVYAPIAADIARNIGRPVYFATNSSYESFSNNLDEELFDIVFVQPFDYVRAADQHNYLPVATRSEPLNALLVVAKDSPLRSVQELKGKKIALPPQNAAVSHLLRAYLKAQGLDIVTEVSLAYHRSHVSCLQQVLIGGADACGTAAPALRFFKGRMNVELKVLGETASIPHTLFAVHRRVPETERQMLLKTILSWSSTPAGKVMLERGKLTPFMPIEDGAYNVVRDLSRD